MNENKALAARYAERAHNLDFGEKWGTYRVTELQPSRLCFFNNVTYKSNVLVRDRQTREFLRRLAEIGIADLGYAEYPVTGMNDGYSYSVILDAAPKKAERVMEIWRDVFVRFGWDDADGEERADSE